MKDPHATLGVSPHASAAEIRRAFRRLALRHHPDRAGEASTATFQAIAAAYAVLASPKTRATASSRAPKRTAPARPARLDRLSGPIASVAARGALRVRKDGTIELIASDAERATGGAVAIAARVPVTCWTCGGLAALHGFACGRCDGEGAVLEPVVAELVLPPGVGIGARFTVAVDALGFAPSLRFEVATGAPARDR